MDSIMVAVGGLVSDEGTLVIFWGIDDNGNEVRFAADHRPAQDILDALAAGEDPLAEVPVYMLRRA